MSARAAILAAPRRSVVLRRLAVAAAALALVAVLAAAYPHDPVAAWDEHLARCAARLPDWFVSSARPFSWLGGSTALALVAGVVGAVLVVRGRWRDTVLLVAAYALSQLGMLAVKDLTDRPRPDVDPQVALPSSSAFPSGHATGAVAVLCLAAILIGGLRTILTASAIAVGVGISRIVLGVHWSSDVAAGWLLGTAIVAGLLALRPGSPAHG